MGDLRVVFKSHHVKGEIDLLCVFPKWGKRSSGGQKKGEVSLLQGSLRLGGWTRHG